MVDSTEAFYDFSFRASHALNPNELNVYSVKNIVTYNIPGVDVPPKEVLYSMEGYEAAGFTLPDAIAGINKASIAENDQLRLDKAALVQQNNDLGDEIQALKAQLLDSTAQYNCLVGEIKKTIANLATL